MFDDAIITTSLHHGEVLGAYVVFGKNENMADKTLLFPPYKVSQSICHGSDKTEKFFPDPDVLIDVIENERKDDYKVLAIQLSLTASPIGAEDLPEVDPSMKSDNFGRLFALANKMVAWYRCVEADEKEQGRAAAIDGTGYKLIERTIPEIREIFIKIMKDGLGGKVHRIECDISHLE